MKKQISERVADAWGVPKDAVMNIPRITLSGASEIYIENHKGILAYGRERIRVATHIGVVCVCGAELSIERIRLEDMLISGKIEHIEYENGHK